MKTAVLFFTAITYISTAAVACDCEDKDTRRYLQYNSRYGLDDSNDGFKASRFESLESKGYRRYYGYDREDEGTINNPKFGYSWDSVH